MVVWDRDDYIMEAESQLGDAEVNNRFENDPSEWLHEIIPDTLKTNSDKGDFGSSHLRLLNCK